MIKKKSMKIPVEIAYGAVYFLNSTNSSTYIKLVNHFQCAAIFNELDLSEVSPC